MVVRYFTHRLPSGHAQALARMDPPARGAERITRQEPAWVAQRALLDLIITSANRDWEEVDRVGAEAFLGELGVDTVLLDRPLGVIGP